MLRRKKEKIYLVEIYEVIEADEKDRDAVGRDATVKRVDMVDATVINEDALKRLKNKVMKMAIEGKIKAEIHDSSQYPEQTMSVDIGDEHWFIQITPFEDEDLNNIECILQYIGD